MRLRRAAPRRLLRAACLALLAAAAAAGKDFYSVLDIARGADDATIKRGYRTLAKCARARLRARIGGESPRAVQRARRCLPGAAVRRCVAAAELRARAQEVAPGQEPGEQGAGGGSLPRGARAARQRCRGAAPAREP
jgi:hypothetical protein